MAVLALLTCLLSSCSPALPYDVYVVEIEVEGHGVITARLVAKSAPVTVKNFIDLAEADFYDGLTFHRAVEGFVIQGGCPNGDGTGNAGETIYGEFFENGYNSNHILHNKGVISMARGNDKNSASCQFFITIADANASLDGKYAGFGYIDDESMPVVMSIAEAMFPNTKNGVITDKKLQPVIKDVRVVDQYDIN